MAGRIPVLCTALIVIAPAWSNAQQAPTPSSARSRDCAALVGIELANARVTEAVAVAPAATGSLRVAHCRVNGVIDKETRFTALLPDEWNERFFAGGAGGYAGSIQNMAQPSVNFGYATVGTDAGHQAIAFDAEWALDNRERQINYGYLAIHRTTEVTKAIIKAYYGRDPRYSYFFGCSNGGRQALMEAQRYPDDYHGIVAMAPALNFTNIAASFIKNIQAVYPDPTVLSAPVVTPENLKLVETKVLAACDARDGVSDNVLDDPRECRFQIGDLPACADDRPGAECVTKAQRAALQRIYQPAAAAGATIYPGQPFGAEGQPGGWQTWITGINQQVAAVSKGQFPSLQFAFSTGFFKYFVFGKRDWDYSKYDLSQWSRDTADAATFLNADNADLSGFKKRGGKLILSHGWADPALNPLATIAYYEQLQARDQQVRDYARLFMMPGVLHCGGGPGPDVVDWFTPIAKWVEEGQAPATLKAEKQEKGTAVSARPLCVYPQRAVYSGSGPTTAFESYTCR